MRQNEFDIKQMFTQENELPRMIQERVQETYDMIRAQENAKSSGKQVKSIKTFSSQRRWYLPKAVAFLIACFLVTGVTAVAAVGILSRWDRMKNMEKGTIEQLYEEIQLSGDLSFQASRSFTDKEQKRYRELEEAYKKDQVMPYSEIIRLKEGENYPGEGVCLRVTEAGEEHVLYLPETELTDEELLEIIDYLAKQEYVFYEMKREQALAKGNWESRLEALTDDEVDYYYLALWSGMSETSDGLCRGTLAGDVLTKVEAVRLQELEKAYEEENVVPAGEAMVIESPAEYTGSGIALCRRDGNFYLPDGELSDEELLQIIDFRKKAYYSMERIREEIRLGYRKDFPKFKREAEEPQQVEALAFAETDGKGSRRAVEEAQIGDMVQFGRYEQDNNAGNGTEAIEWYVLDASEDEMTLLAVNILDALAFSSEQKVVTWKESEIRQWLNEDFYEKAFDRTEQTDILTTVTESDQGEHTEDKVYLLSQQEFLAYFGVSADALMKMSSAKENEIQNLKNLERLDSRIFTKGTQAALANGLWSWTEETTLGYLKFQNVDYSNANGNSAWWLRTADGDGPSAHTIAANGDVDSPQYVDSIEGVRPVIKIQR